MDNDRILKGQLRGINGDRRRCDLGGEHPIHDTDEILWNTLATYLILLTNVIPINPIKIKKTLSQIKDN